MTEDKLVQALRNAQRQNVADRQGFKTARELAAETGWTKRKLLDGLHELKAAGQLEIGEVVIMNLADKPQTVPAYRWTNHSHETTEDKEG